VALRPYPTGLGDLRPRGRACRHPALGPDSAHRPGRPGRCRRRRRGGRGVAGEAPGLAVADCHGAGPEGLPRPDPARGGDRAAVPVQPARLRRGDLHRGPGRSGDGHLRRVERRERPERHRRARPGGVRAVRQPSGPARHRGGRQERHDRVLSGPDRRDHLGAADLGAQARPVGDHRRQRDARDRGGGAAPGPVGGRRSAAAELQGDPRPRSGRLGPRRVQGRRQGRLDHLVPGARNRP